MTNAQTAYENTKTMGMSQLDLILSVYQGTIKYLNQARADFKTESFVSGRNACDKARKCIVHLYTTLDMEQGGEIAERLGHLYAFMIEQIDVAVACKSQEIFDDLIGLLSTIKEGWAGLKAQEGDHMQASGQINGAKLSANNDNREPIPENNKNNLSLSA